MNSQTTLDMISSIEMNISLLRETTNIVINDALKQLKVLKERVHFDEGKDLKNNRRNSSDDDSHHTDDTDETMGDSDDAPSSNKRKNEDNSFNSNKRMFVPSRSYHNGPHTPPSKHGVCKAENQTPLYLQTKTNQRMKRSKRSLALDLLCEREVSQRMLDF